MADFHVTGPMAVPVEKKKAGRTISTANAGTFWQDNQHIGAARGCYVFGIKTNKGIVPAYVGQAKKSFKQEVFAPHKLNKYHAALADYMRGTPVLFFVTAPTGRGRPNESQIDELEYFLIQEGLAVNPALLNERRVKKVGWTIVGVVRAGKGRPSKGAVTFRKMLGL